MIDRAAGDGHAAAGDGSVDGDGGGGNDGGLVVRATVKIAVAAAVRAKEVTTLAARRACGELVGRIAAPVQQRMSQFQNDE